MWYMIERCVHVVYDRVLYSCGIKLFTPCADY